MKYPLENELMFYDDKIHQYILKPQMTVDYWGEDLNIVLDTSWDANPSTVPDRVLREVSRDVYRYIYKLSQNQQFWETWISTTKEGGKYIFEMLAAQVPYTLVNGYINHYGGVNIAKGVVMSDMEDKHISPAVKDLADTIIPSLGVSMTYCGVLKPFQVMSAESEHAQSSSCFANVKLVGKLLKFYDKNGNVLNTVELPETNLTLEQINNINSIATHIANKSNPHGVTAAQVGALVKTATAANSLKLDGKEAEAFALKTEVPTDFVRTAQLSTETEARKNADTDLQNKLKTETEERKAADSGLSSRITAAETKVNNSVLLPDFDETNYVITFRTNSGEIKQVDLPIESLAHDLDFDTTTNELVITKEDGSTIRVPLTGLIDVYTGGTSSTAQVLIDNNNQITVNLLNNSVTFEKLATTLQTLINSKANAADLTAHTADTNAHVSTLEKNTWNGKLGKTETATDSAKLGGKEANQFALGTDLSAHTSNAGIHASASEKAVWNAKQNAITGAASSVTVNNLLANLALISDANGKIGASSISATILGYLSGLTSNVQSQLNAKLSITASSLATNGYVVFSNGLKIMWGVRQSSTTSFSFPYINGFTNINSYSIVANVQTFDYGAAGFAQVLKESGTKAIVRARTSSGIYEDNVCWVAIGY